MVNARKRMPGALSMEHREHDDAEGRRGWWQEATQVSANALPATQVEGGGVTQVGRTRPKLAQANADDARRANASRYVELH